MDLNSTEESWACSKPKYGELKPLVTNVQRKIQSFHPKIKRRHYENWDSDFEGDDMNIPQQLHVNSKSLNIEMNNFRRLSEKTLVLRKALDEINRPNNQQEKSGDTIIDEALELVQFISETSLNQEETMQCVQRLLSREILPSSLSKLGFTKDLVPPLIDHIDDLIFKLNTF